MPAALQKLNELYGTAYESIDDIFTVQTDGGERALVTDPALQAIFNAKNDALYDESRLTIKPLDMEAEYRTAYGWFTVTAPAGGKLEADCKASGVNFIAVEGVTVPPEEEEENENLCQFCGEDHSGSLWQKFVGFIHKIFCFFAHLFGKK